MKKQSDIEIYVKGCSIDVLLEWIENAIGKLERVPDTGEEMIYNGKTARLLFQWIMVPSQAFGSIRLKRLGLQMLIVAGTLFVISIVL